MSLFDGKPDYAKGLFALGALHDPLPPRRPIGALGLLSSVVAPPAPAQRARLGLINSALSSAAERKRSHTSILESLVDGLVAAGFVSVTADLSGWETPTKIVWNETQEGHRPDARAWTSGREFIFEVETAETIAIEHTRQQCRLFAAYANPRGGKFILVVPDGDQVRAKAQLVRWGIAGEVW